MALVGYCERPCSFCCQLRGTLPTHSQDLVFVVVSSDAETSHKAEMHCCPTLQGCSLTRCVAAHVPAFLSFGAFGTKRDRQTFCSQLDRGRPIHLHDVGPNSSLVEEHDPIIRCCAIASQNIHIHRRCCTKKIDAHEHICPGQRSYFRR